MSTIESTLKTERTMRRIPSRAAVGAVVMCLLSLGCEIKPAKFLEPSVPYTPIHTMPLDITMPTFSGAVPGASLSGPFSISSFKLNFDDPQGTNGATPSGPDYSSVVARVGSTTLSTSRSGNQFTASLTGLPDGANMIMWSGRDIAGNNATYSQSLNLDNSPPTISILDQPPGSVSITDRSYALSYRFSYADANPGAFTGSLLRPADGQPCGTAGDTPYTKGTAGGQVSENTFTFSGGMTMLNVNAFNGVNTGDQPRTARYCLKLVAQDGALSETGAAKPNTTTRFIETMVDWRPPLPTTGTITGSVTFNGAPAAGIDVRLGNGTPVPTDAAGAFRFDNVTPGSQTVSIVTIPANVTCTPGASQSVNVVAGQTVNVTFVCTQSAPVFTIGFVPSYRHIMPGLSETCLLITTTPPQANAAFTGTISGPGVIGSATFSGTLSASGTVTVRTSINATGSYTGSVTVGTTTSTYTIVVNPAAGTCAAPPP